MPLSSRFTIETADAKAGKKYRQTFRENMSVREDPKVTPMSSKDTEYTCVTFEPDFARFKMDGYVSLPSFPNAQVLPDCHI